MYYILSAVVLLGTQIWKNKDRENIKKNEFSKKIRKSAENMYIKYT